MNYEFTQHLEFNWSCVTLNFQHNTFFAAMSVSKSFGELFCNPHALLYVLIPIFDSYCTVFVTGNANKLKEVRAILASGSSGIEVTNQAVDGKSSLWRLVEQLHLINKMVVIRNT